MTIDRLRAMLVNRLLVASDDMRRARAAHDDAAVLLIEVERDTLFSVIALLDADPDGQ